MIDMENKDLTFDGPVETQPWPRKLKLAMLIPLFVIFTIVSIWIGWSIDRVADNTTPLDDFAPISFVTPARVADKLGERPSVPDLPDPSIHIPGGEVPMQVVRTLDCVSLDCPDETMPVLASLRWIEVNTDGTVLNTFPVFDDQEYVYFEGEQYEVRSITSITLNIGPLSIPDQVSAYIEDTGRAVTAWRIESTIKPDRVDGRSAAWTSEVFHVIREGAL